MIKRILTIAVLALAVTAGLAGCSDTASTMEKDGGKPKVVCTVFPQYDWARVIIGDRLNEIDLSVLIENRVDLHNFQPSASDIVNISQADLFIYVGGESDEWVKDALAESVNPNQKAVSLIELLGDQAKTEEIIEGMENIEEPEQEEGLELDEHVWLSLTNAKIFCEAIAGEISKLDPDNAEEYLANKDAYIENLDAINGLYEEELNSSKNKTLIFADRFPFRYLMDDYGLEYYAAFPGCSAEVNASFETIVFLAEKADELKLNTVLVTESSDKSIANTIIENTGAKNQEILVVDSMQSVSMEDIESRVTYISVMEKNLLTIQKALRE